MDFDSIWINPQMFKYNKDIVNGLEGKNVSGMIDVIDSLLRGVFDSTRRLQYIGYDIKSARELYDSSLATIDILRSDFIPVTLKFVLPADNNMAIQQMFAVPYLDSPELYVNGVRYMIRPIINSDVCSIRTGWARIDTFNIKKNFFTAPFTVVINGNVTMKGFMTANDLYKPINGKGRKVQLPTMMLVFIELGFVSTLDEYFLKDGYIIRYIGQPQIEGYTTFKSFGKDARVEFLVKDEILVDNPDIEIIIDIISSVLHMANISATPIMSILSGEERESDMLEFIFMAFYQEKGGNVRYYKTINSIKNYIDSESQKKLKASGIFVSTFSELILYITRNKNASPNESDYYEDRHWGSTYHMLHQFAIKINGVASMIDNMGNKPITNQLIKAILRKELYPKSLYSVVAPPVLPVTRPSNPCASKIPKMNLMVDDANRGNGVHAAKDPGIPIEYMTLSGAQVHVGNLNAGPDGFPVPISTMNPFLNIKDGRIVLSQDEIDTISKLNKILRR